MCLSFEISFAHLYFFEISHYSNDDSEFAGSSKKVFSLIPILLLLFVYEKGHYKERNIIKNIVF